MSTIASTPLSRRSLAQAWARVPAPVRYCRPDATLFSGLQQPAAPGQRAFSITWTVELPMLQAIMAALVGPHPGAETRQIWNCAIGASWNKTTELTSSAAQKQGAIFSAC